MNAGSLGQTAADQTAGFSKVPEPEGEESGQEHHQEQDCHSLHTPLDKFGS